MLKFSIHFWKVNSWIIKSLIEFEDFSDKKTFWQIHWWNKSIDEQFIVITIRILLICYAGIVWLVYLLRRKYWINKLNPFAITITSINTRTFAQIYIFLPPPSEIRHVTLLNNNNKINPNKKTKLKILSLSVLRNMFQDK